MKNLNARQTAAFALIEQAQQMLARAYELTIHDENQSPATWLAENIKTAHDDCNSPLSLLNNERTSASLQSIKDAWANR